VTWPINIYEGIWRGGVLAPLILILALRWRGLSD
jgi:hypothetical protein